MKKQQRKWNLDNLISLRTSCLVEAGEGHGGGEGREPEILAKFNQILPLRLNRLLPLDDVSFERRRLPRLGRREKDFIDGVNDAISGRDVAQGDGGFAEHHLS